MFRSFRPCALAYSSLMVTSIMKRKSCYRPDERKSADPVPVGALCCFVLSLRQQAGYQHVLPCAIHPQCARQTMKICCLAQYTRVADDKIPFRTFHNIRPSHVLKHIAHFVVCSTRIPKRMMQFNVRSAHVSKHVVQFSIRPARISTHAAHTNIGCVGFPAFVYV